MSEPQFIRHDVDSCLAHVVEECGEVCAAIGKTQRWGLDSVNPLLSADQQETNRDWVKREIIDLRDALHRLEMAL